jgi:hypothetical protein
MHVAIEFDGSEELGDILHQRFELAGFIEICGLVLEELVVLFERGPAAGGIRNDGVEFARRLIGQDCVDVPAGEGAGLLANTRMDMQRAAAGLGGGDNDVSAVLLQHANGSFVQTRK